jgi:uncharacterized Zn-finger protein
LLAAAMVLFAAASVAAHHGFAGDTTSTSRSKSPVSCRRSNGPIPHARFYVDVKDASGKVTTWNFELASLNSLAPQRVDADVAQDR